MSQKYLIRIAELERLLSEQAEALRQKDQQLSLVEETEAFLRSALARAEEKIEEDEREIEHLRAQIEKLRRMLFGKRSARAQHDDWLKREIQRVYDENHQVYGVRKVWRQLLREGIRVARCTVARLMAVMGLAGVLRGKKVRTTISRKAVAAGDRVNRQFVAERPDQLWVADFTYVSTWQGFVYVAFIIDVFAGYIVGWRVSSSMETTFVLDALEQALWARRPSGTVHHSDKGSQYVSLAYTQRLKEAGLLAST